MTTPAAAAANAAHAEDLRAVEVAEARCIDAHEAASDVWLASERTAADLGAWCAAEDAAAAVEADACHKARDIYRGS